MGLSLARASLSAKPDPAVTGPGGALGISFYLCLVSMGRNLELQQLVDLLLHRNGCWIDQRWWHSHCRAILGLAERLRCREVPGPCKLQPRLATAFAGGGGVFALCLCL